MHTPPPTQSHSRSNTTQGGTCDSCSKTPQHRSIPIPLAVSPLCLHLVLFCRQALPLAPNCRAHWTKKWKLPPPRPEQEKMLTNALISNPKYETCWHCAQTLAITRPPYPLQKKMLTTASLFQLQSTKLGSALQKLQYSIAPPTLPHRKKKCLRQLSSSRSWLRRHCTICHDPPQKPLTRRNEDCSQLLQTFMPMNT